MLGKSFKVQEWFRMPFSKLQTHTVIFAAFIAERFLSVSSKCCVEAGLFKMCEMVI